MEKQKVQPRTSSYQYQSSAQRNVLVDFLSNKSNDLKWLRYARNKLSMLAKFGNTGCLEAQDYVSEAKVLILELVTVIGVFTENPRFKMTKNGKSFIMSLNELNDYFYRLIKWNISHFVRNEQKLIPLPSQDEDYDNDPYAEDDIKLCKKNPDSEFIVPFKDPFDENQNLLSEEFLERICKSLEARDPLFEKVFEERLNGVPNRLIARKYKIPVRKVESIRKIIRRHLNNLDLGDGDLDSTCVPV